MSRFLLCGGMALILSGCFGLGAPQTTTLVDNITCPAEPPPEIPELPDRADDLRLMPANRERIDGIWAGVVVRQDAYRETHSECPKGNI